MFLKRFYTLLLLLSATGFGICQTDSSTLKSIYDKEVIYFSGNKYVKNEIKYPLKELVNEFDKETEAYFLYQSYKKDHRKAIFCYITGTLLTISSLVVSSDNKEVGTGLLWGGIISYSITFGYGIRADKKLKKAVWMRNRDIMLR